MGDVLEREATRASRLRLSPPHGHGKAIHRRRQAREDRARRVEAALKKLTAGELVTDREFNAVVAGRLLESDCRNGFILDGFPASADQAEFLDTLLDPKTADLLTVIYLDLPDDVALARMEERARADDKRGFGEERLRQFRANIASVLDYYKEDGLFTVDATQKLEAVEREVDGIIVKRQAASEQAGSEPAKEPSSSGK
jgi:adenylate kinase